MRTIPRRAASLIGLAAAACLLPGAGLGPRSASADEAQRLEQTKALVEQLDAARRAADRAELERLIPQVAELHNALDDKAARGKLQAAVGDVLDEDGLSATTRLLAADTLGGLHDERVWTQLKREWPALDLEAALPLQIRVVQAAGKVAAPASAGALIDLLRGGRDANLVRTSVEALGRFGWAKNRVSVLQALGDTIPRTETGGGGGRPVSRDVADALRELRPALLAAMNELTGRSEPTLEAWTELLKTHRKRLDSLFLRERP